MQTFRYYLLLTLLCLGLYLPGLASLPLLDRDEPHFAQATRQMLETQNYWQIHFQDEPRHLKPPGIYWLQAAVVHTFSNTNSTTPWPYRLPSVIGALLAVLLTFEFSRRITNIQTAGLAAIFLACSLLLVVEAHLAVTDATLLATMVAMQFALGQIYQRYRQQLPTTWHWPLLFWLAMAAGVFIKGITPLVAGLTLLGLCIADRNIRWLKTLRYPWGIPLLLFITASWLIPFSVAAGGNFLWDMIHTDLLPKFAGNQQSHGMPPGYFTVLLTPTFWPASLFIVPTGIWAWRHREEFNPRFLLAWIVPTWICFELVRTKLPEYVLPVYPAIALLVAWALMSGIKPLLNRWQQMILILQQILWIACTLALVAAAIYLQAWLTAGLVFIAAGYLLYVYYHPPLYRYAAIGMIIASTAFIPVWQSAQPQQAPWISHRLAALITATAPTMPSSQNPVLAVDYQEPSLVFLLGTQHILITGMADALAYGPPRPNRLLLITPASLPCFTALMQGRHLAWQLLGQVQGLQYNRGRSIIVYLILITGSTDELTNPNQANLLGAMARNLDHQLLFCGSTLNSFHALDRPASALDQRHFSTDHPFRY